MNTFKCQFNRNIAYVFDDFRNHDVRVPIFVQFLNGMVVDLVDCDGNVWLYKSNKYVFTNSYISNLMVNIVDEGEHYNYSPLISEVSSLKTINWSCFFNEYGPDLHKSDSRNFFNIEFLLNGNKIVGCGSFVVYRKVIIISLDGTDPYNYDLPIDEKISINEVLWPIRKKHALYEYPLFVVKSGCFLPVRKIKFESTFNNVLVEIDV